MHFDMSMNVDNVLPLAMLEEKVDRCFNEMEVYYNDNGGLGILVFEHYLREFNIDIETLPDYLADKLYTWL